MEPLSPHVLELGRRALAEQRLAIENAGPETDEDEALQAYLLRIVEGLEALLEPAPAEEGELRILAQALRTFCPVLGLDWLPEKTEEPSGPRAKREVLLDALGWERAIEAALRGAKRSLEPWRQLVDLASESLVIFMASGDAAGIERCLRLLEEIEAQVEAAYALGA